MIDYATLRPLLFKLPPEIAHYVALASLKLSYHCHLLKAKPCANSGWQRQIMGLNFPNPIGLAAGLDKNADYVDALANLGFGFIEVGTVTPKPQRGNPKPRLFRLSEHQALINRMGFNNKGVDYLVNKLHHSRYNGILGINIGKNKATPNEQAIDDYLFCLDKVYPYASYITVNISSPNTPGLRNLQFGTDLDKLLMDIKSEQLELANRYQLYKPLLVKVAPDLTADQARDIATHLIKNNIDGVITCNTAIDRYDIAGHVLAKQQGGLSGEPIAHAVNRVIRVFANALQTKVAIIGLGGVMDKESLQEKFDSGANLVQLYTGLIYRGPGLVRSLLSN